MRTRKRPPSKAAATYGRVAEIVQLGRSVIADRGGLSRRNEALTIAPLVTVKASLKLGEARHG